MCFSLMNRSPIVIVCGFALLIIAALLVVLRERRPAPLPELRGAQTSADVRVKAVDRKAELLEKGLVASVSGAVAIVCGEDAATAGRYEARNDALRSDCEGRTLVIRSK